jgi:hypothetical protein
VERQLTTKLYKEWPAVILVHARWEAPIQADNVRSLQTEMRLAQ